MTLADRLNKIIEEQNISKAEFARRMGVTENYVYILTGKGERSTENKISKSFAKLISLEFGYDEDWVLNGDE